MEMVVAAQSKLCFPSLSIKKRSGLNLFLSSEAKPHVKLAVAKIAQRMYFVIFYEGDAF
jgi:hypothetical protein